jgi:hypothetical protein
MQSPASVANDDVRAVSPTGDSQETGRRYGHEPAAECGTRETLCDARDRSEGPRALRRIASIGVEA